jgi:indole-3-glycerol phosphate synthase
MTILDKIISNKKTELTNVKSHTPIEFYQKMNFNDRAIHSLRQELDHNRDFQFICEIKKASPSQGIIRTDFDPVKQAQQYLDAGADAISILTDEKYFMGKLDHLQAVRKIVNLPILRKDFIIDPYQIYESRCYGADVILLIARILSKSQIAEFIRLAAELHLEVLLEIACQTDMEKIPQFRKNIILGINNRNLHTFEVNIENSLMLKPLLPTGIPVISESGIATAADCRWLYENGFAGALIGESLMRSACPKTLLNEFRKEIANAG